MPFGRFRRRGGMRGRRFSIRGRRSRGRSKLYGRIVTSRISVDAVTATDATDTTITLLAAKDDPDETIETDGTNIAECEAGAKILSMKLKVYYGNMSPNSKWAIALLRNPRGTLTPATSDLLTFPTSAAQMLFHKNLASFMVGRNDATKRAQNTVRLTLPRRLRFMNDADKIQIVRNASGATAGTSQLSIYGIIKWLKP